jgi:thiol-disulfide isomerase/thioredoxin
MPSGFSTPRLLGAALVILVAGAAGFLASRARHADGSKLTAAPSGPAVQPDMPPAPQEATARKAVPTTLPDISLADMNGKSTRLVSFAGRPLMVNFWATWCAPCRREIPLLNKIRGERKPQNAEIVGIAVDFKEDVAKFLTKTPLQYPLLVGEEDGLAAAEAFGMGMAFPFSVFVDSQNRILTIKIGELHEDEANFAFDRLQDIDKGVMTLAAAQAAVNDAFRTMAANRAVSGSGDAQGPAH